MSSELSKCLKYLRKPDRLWSIKDMRAQPQLTPASPGVYGWYFKRVPPNVPSKRAETPKVPTAGCMVHEGHSLLYTGVASDSLRSRLKQHIMESNPEEGKNRNASWSTLRKTLGVLLAYELKIELRLIKEDGRVWFGDKGEGRLLEWMSRNAGVAWIETPDPLSLERDLIEVLAVPLNIRKNTNHPFHEVLAPARRAAVRRARKLPPMSRYD